MPLVRHIPAAEIKWHGRPLPTLSHAELLACCEELFNAYQELAGRALQGSRLRAQDFIDAIKEAQR